MIPQMMVRIDDRQIGVEDLLDELAEPFRLRQRARVASGFDGHGVLPGVWVHYTPPITAGGLTNLP
jgi:hypothetical protein